jgi:hypothetical protein
MDKAAQKITTQNDLIVSIFEKLRSFLDRFAIHMEPNGTISSKLERILAETLCQLLVILGLATKVVNTGRAGKAISRLSSTSNSDFDSEIRGQCCCSSRGDPASVHEIGKFEYR